MARFWNRDFLNRRIDRCYLIAAGAKNPEKRKIHLELARHYRKILSSLTGRHPATSAEWSHTPATVTES